MIVEALLVAKGIYDYRESKSNSDHAQKINSDAIEKIAKSKQNINNQYSMTENSLLKLSNRRKSIYQSTFKVFLETMKPLKKIILTEIDLEFMSELQGKLQEFISISSYSNVKKVGLSNTEAITSYMLFGVPGYLKKKSEIALSQSRIVEKSATTYNIHSETIISYLKYIENQSEIMSELTLRFNLLLIQCLKQLDSIIQEKGANKNLYTLDDRQLMRICFNLADAIKKITSPTILEDDYVSQAFINAISYGKEQLISINKLIDQQNSNLQKFKIR